MRSDTAVAAAGAYASTKEHSGELGESIPLLGVRVDAELKGFFSRVVMRQRFRNDQPAPIEAVYVFPAPENAAVTGLVIETGGRRIVGKVKEREAAFDHYDEALAAGHGAVLLDQHRPNVFQASVGNLLPGQEMVVELTWVMELAWEGEALRFTLPTTVAPRYAPLEDRQGIGQTEAEKLNPPTSFEVPYGLELQAEVDIPGGITRIESPSHPLRWQLRDGGATIQLSQESAAMNEDLVLLITPASPREPHAFLERQADGGVVAAVSFVPQLEQGPRTPREVIFLIDRSGSMEGSSIAEARRALQLSLRSLQEGDRFDIVGFGSRFVSMFGKSRTYTQASLDEAAKHVKKLGGDMGGTEVLPALLHVLERPPAGMQRAVILVTDGEVTNEADVIEAARRHAASTRVFTIGVGYGPSEHFINGVARASGGASEFITPGERIEPKVLRQLARLAAPVLDDLRLEWNGEALADRAPYRLLQLFDGEPFLTYLRPPDLQPGAVRLTGRLGGRELGWDVPVDPASAAEGAVIGPLAARAFIRDLEEGTSPLHEKRGSQQPGRRDRRITRAIVDLGVRYQLATSHTSFVAVEEREGAEDRQRGQLVLVPQALTRDWGGLIAASAVDHRISMGSAPRGRWLLSMDQRMPLPDGFAESDACYDQTAAQPRARMHLFQLLRARSVADDRLTVLQRADGSWPLDQSLSKAVGVGLAKLRKVARSLQGVDEAEAVVATAAALVWLRTRAAASIDEWRLLAEKAEAWLDGALDGTPYSREEIEHLIEAVL